MPFEVKCAYRVILDLITCRRAIFQTIHATFPGFLEFGPKVESCSLKR